MKNYFRLHEECYYVSDITGEGVIYNTFDGNVYRLTKLESDVLKLLENNYSIDDVIKRIAGISRNELIKKLDIYSENEIGTYYENPVYIHKLMLDYKAIDFLPSLSSHYLNKAIISLSSECYAKCEFCYPNRYVGDTTCICCTGLEKSLSEQYMKYEILQEILEHLSKLQCSLVCIKIADIQTREDYFFKCLDLVSKYHFDKTLIIIGNGRIKKDLLYRVIQYKFEIILQKEVTKSIIDEAVNLYTSISNEKIDNLGILYIVYSEDEGNKLKDLIFSSGQNVTNIIISRYVKEDEALDYYLKKPVVLSRIDLRTFSYKHYFHPCLGGLIYFSQNGDIFPCPNLLDFKMGNVNNFKEIWGTDGLKDFWKRTAIDNVKKCNTCAVRYICQDCRANEYLLGQDIFNKVTCNK